MLAVTRPLAGNWRLLSVYRQLSAQQIAKTPCTWFSTAIVSRTSAIPHPGRCFLPQGGYDFDTTTAVDMLGRAG